MSVSSLGTAHLQQTKLSTKAVDMLKPIADWLSELQFTPAEVEFETLNHPQLKAKMTPLLTELGLTTKVHRTIHIELYQLIYYSDTLSRGSLDLNLHHSTILQVLLHTLYLFESKMDTIPQSSIVH